MGKIKKDDLIAIANANDIELEGSETKAEISDLLADAEIDISAPAEIETNFRGNPVSTAAADRRN